MGQALSGQREPRDGLLQKDHQYDEKALAKIAAKFNAEDTCLQALLAEQLEGEVDDIAAALREQLEGQGGTPSVLKPDLSKELASIATLRLRVAGYLQRVRPDAIRERNKVKVKLTNVKRFVLSHLKNLYATQGLLLKEIDQLRQAYIDNFLRMHQKIFHNENKICFDQVQMKRTRVENFSQDSKKTTVSGPGSNQIHEVHGQEAHDEENLNLSHISAMENYEQDSQLNSSSCSEDMYLPEAEHKGAVFELYFTTYYTRYDSVQFPIFVYLTPKTESDYLTFGSPKRQKPSAPAAGDDWNEPVFIGTVTSEFLFQRSKQALQRTYKSKTYVNKYALEARSLMTFDCNSECIDFMLSKGQHKLADFLYSQVNTNSEKQPSSTNGNNQLFDSSQLRYSIKFDIKNMQNINSFGQREQANPGGAQDLILKLKICFVERIYLAQVQAQQKLSVRKQSIQDYELLKILGQGAFAKVLQVRHKVNGKLFAMKVIHKNKIMMDAEHDGSITTEELAYRNMYRVKQIISERNIFSLLNQRPHPFIVQLHSAFTSKNYLYLVLDLCPGGDLFNLIQRHKNFTPKQARLLFAEVVLAVEHLHNHDILYRDLKPENILIDEWGHLKLTDFGLSKENFTEFDEAKTICGSPEYFCPEILSDQHYGRTLDYYSLGVLLYELITGLPPYYNQDQIQMQKDIVSADLRVSHLSGDSLSLIQGLLEKDPSKRLGKVGGIKAIKDHPFFNEISWRDVRKKRYRYGKQYLKIDLTKTNFPFQQDLERKDQFDIGIDVEEECKPTAPKRRAADSKPLVLVEQRQIGKQRSKSQQQLSHGHHDLLASDAGDSDASSSSSSSSSDEQSNEDEREASFDQLMNQGAGQKTELRQKYNTAAVDASDEEDQDQQNPGNPNGEAKEEDFEHLPLKRAATDVDERKAALRLAKRHTATGPDAYGALQAQSKQRDIIKNFKLNKVPEVENESKRSAGRAMSMRLGTAGAAAARAAASAAGQDQQHAGSARNRVGVLREESIVPIAEMSEVSSSEDHEGDAGQTALGMLQSASQNRTGQLPGQQLNFEGFSYQLEFNSNRKAADFASSSQRDSLPEHGKAGSHAEAAQQSRVSSRSPSPGRVSVISNAQRDKSDVSELQQRVDADANKELNLKVHAAGPHPRASAGGQQPTDHRRDGPARPRVDSALFDGVRSPASSARNGTVQCDRQAHMDNMNRAFFPSKPKDSSPEVTSKRLSTEFGLEEDIKEADDKINIPLIQVVHRSATQTMNYQKSIQNIQSLGVPAAHQVKIAKHDQMSQHSAQKSQAASVKQLSRTSSSEIQSNRSWDNTSDQLEDVRVQMLSPQINMPPILAADEDIQYMSSHSSQYSEKRASKMNSPKQSRTSSPGRLSREHRNSNSNEHSSVLFQAACVNDVLSLRKCPAQADEENIQELFASNQVSPDRASQASRRLNHNSQRKSFNHLHLDPYARSSTTLEYAKDDVTKAPQKNAVIKTISTNLLTSFEENFEWNRPAASRRESKASRLSRPDFSKKQPTEDLAETGPFKRHIGDLGQQPSSNIENSEQERGHQKRSKQLQESAVFDSRKRPDTNNRMVFQSHQHNALAPGTETHSLIEYIDQFRNSLLNDEAAFNDEMRQNDKGYRLQSSKAFAKSKGHVKNNKSLDQQQLKQKQQQQQQKIIAMKLMATNDVKIERKRRGTLQTALNLPIGANGLMQVPANVQRKNFEEKFKRRQTTALQATELDQIVEDVDDLNASCYQVTDQSVGQDSKHSKMKNISLTAGKKRKSSTYLTTAQVDVLNSEAKAANKSSLLSFQAQKTRYDEGLTNNNKFSKRMSVSSSGSRQVQKAAKQASNIPIQKQDPKSLYNITNTLAPAPSGGQKTPAKTQNQPPSPDEKLSQSSRDGFHQRLASKHLHDSSDGDPTPAMSYDHSIQVQKHAIYSKETQSQQRNQNLKASGFTYTIHLGGNIEPKTDDQTGGADDFYQMQQKDPTQRSLEQIIQSQIDSQLEMVPHAKYESVPSMSVASSKAVSVSASSGPGAARYQNTRDQPAHGLRRELSRRKPQQSSIQAAQPAAARHIKASKTSQGTTSSAVHDRSSIVTNEEISPRKIKMSERIVQKANLTLDPKAKRKSQVITKQITMPPKPLAPQASVLANRQHTSQPDNSDSSEVEASQSTGLRVLNSTSKFRQLQHTSHFKSPRNVLVHSGIKSPSMQGKGGRAPLPQSRLEAKPPNAAKYGSHGSSPMAEHFIGTTKPPAWSCAASPTGSQDGGAGAHARSDGSRGTRRPAPAHQQRPKHHATFAHSATVAAPSRPAAPKAQRNPNIRQLDFTD